MTNRGEVLVAIINNKPDWKIACEQHWYRIPVSSVKKLLKNRFPPKWLAFYQTKIFGEEAYAIQYYATVLKITEVTRSQLFPDCKSDRKAQKRYYKLQFKDLQQLPQPILSRRLRRLVFIPTTWQKFITAVEINDLWDESPLEDKLWAELKRHEIQAERQEYVKVKNKNYCLDFAIYCAEGKINIETDGDTWHSNKKQIPLDNERDNALETQGWRTLRFNTYHVREQMTQYCIPTIAENINRLGGIKNNPQAIPRKVEIAKPGEWVQLKLFDFE
jgi:very-short-patch-repair endonuclease